MAHAAALAGSTASVEVCSTTQPLCLRAVDGAREHLAARLEVAEHALESLRIVGLPQPLRRLERGVVVLDDSEGPGESSPCERETRIVRTVAFAAVAATGADAVSQDVLGESFVALMSPCRSDRARADDERGRRTPERGFPGNGPRLLGWLDGELGAAGPGRFLAGLTTRFPRADLFGVLRENTKDAFFSGSTFGDAVAAFGLTQILPLRQPAWNIEWPRQPRALALPEPLGPLGSAGIRLQVPPGRAASPSLRIEASWEQRADLRLAVVALDAAGAELQKAWIPGRARIPEASFTFREVAGARALLIVLTSLGDPFERLDTRALALEPHGAIVTLAELE